MYVQREFFATLTDFDDSFFIGKGYLRVGPILIWSSSDDRINVKITEISYSYEQIIEIIINQIIYQKKKKTILKHSFKIRQRFERIPLFMN